MIYLIKSGGINNRFLLKIGYAKDVDKRMKQYKTHNPEIELLGTREGEEDLEIMLHKYFDEFSYPEQPEWFYYNDEIIEKFSNLTLKEIEDKSINVELSKFIPTIDSDKKNSPMDLFLNKYPPTSLSLSQKSIKWIYREIELRLNKDNIHEVLEEIEFSILEKEKTTKDILKNIQEDELWKKVSNSLLRDYYITEKLEFDNKTYLDDLSVIQELRNLISLNTELDEFFDLFHSTRSFEVKMKLYCEEIEKIGIENIKFVPAKFYDIYNSIGPKKIKALKYREKGIEDYLAVKKVENKLYKELINTFRVGDRKSLVEIKSTLGVIYKGLGLNITPKASDLNKFFLTKKIKTENRSDGFEIISHTIDKDPTQTLSMFDRAYITDRSTKINIEDIFDIIKTGKGGIREVIEKIRSNSNHQEQNRLKYLNLPMVCWNGIFEKRNAGSIKEYSSYLALDIDSIDEKSLTFYRTSLKQIPYIRAIFLSPSGKGLKVIIQHNNIDASFHRDLFMELKEKLGIEEFDCSVSDLARGNYLSYDPDIYINNDCMFYKFTPGLVFYPKEEKEKEIPYLSSENSLEDNRILGCLDSYWHKKYPESWEEGNRHSSVLKQASKLNKVGIEKDRTLSYLSMSFDIPKREILNIVNYIYQSNSSDFGIDRESFNL